MPIYEYKCKKCQHKFEKIQQFSDSPIKKCPKCSGPVEKVLHAPNVQFKGSGFYVNDYAGKSTSGEKSGAAEKSGSKDGETSSPKDKEKDTKAKKAEPKKASKD